MENKKVLIKELIIRLILSFLLIITLFCLITFPISIYRGLYIYINKEKYINGIMRVEDITRDSYGSPYLYAKGDVNNIKIDISLGLARNVKVQDNYPVLYNPDSRYAFLITNDFKFKPLNYFVSSIIELVCIPFFLLIIFKTIKYFKNDKIHI